MTVSWNKQYSKDQLSKYLTRINYFKEGEVFNDNILPSLDTLRRIIRCHTTSIPYGNLSFHYYKSVTQSETHEPANFLDRTTTSGVSVHLEDIYNKLVIEKRDGYCFENNLLCSYMLLAIGFNLYISGSKIVQSLVWDQHQKVELTPMIHCCLIVELDGQDYMADVGLRLGISSEPLLMREGVVTQTNPLIEHRLVRTSYPEELVGCTNSKYTPWVLEAKYKRIPNTRYHPRNDWSPITYTTPFPIYLNDIQALNTFVVNDDSVIFRKLITMAINTPSGYINLNNQTLRIFTEFGVEKIDLNTEMERRLAYLKYFGVNLSLDLIEHLPN
ncbi:cysteine proteinase [Conidiobolus coronatus NRRL 28638]|uniref:Cysteine proteinase n=1 Tax=Conidiobolus coronatus (strain ATCC 28846 / CBS 209.66 / NRRL 28638) TaxID=796925 RepID=A0A137P2R7_CONC2|nr:cysteine proteinase [Conidiobolus coronatus NRRL 28638]|eukprot:KXN69221.1 cysteine proteinase [Conidiobolus coronatus NRRL 28638]